jgi:hypothetical protein
MARLTREEFAAALKVPIIMGRGRAYGVVIGDRRLHGLCSWLREFDPEAASIIAAGHRAPFGMHMIITIKHPDTFFAVTEPEYADMLKLLGGNVVSDANVEGQHLCSVKGCTKNKRSGCCSSR